MRVSNPWTARVDLSAPRRFNAHMAIAATITEAIEQMARQGFASVTIAGQTTTVKSVDELIKADIWVAAQESKTRAWKGVRVDKIEPYYP